MDRRQVVQARVTIGVADRDVRRRRVVAPIDRENAWGREAVNRRQHRRLDEPAVGQWEEVEAVVDHIELVRPLEGMRDVEAFDDLRVNLGIFRIPAVDDGREPTRGHRVTTREQRHVDPFRDQPFRQQRGKLLPRAVVTRRNPPRDRSQHSDTQTAGGTGSDGASRLRHSPTLFSLARKRLPTGRVRSGAGSCRPRAMIRARDALSSARPSAIALARSSVNFARRPATSAGSG